jgi:hypothetical protein
MSYKSAREILNSVFDSSNNSLKAVYKTDGEIFNMILDETGEPALRVNIDGIQSGGGIIDGESETFAELPTAPDHTGEIYLVKNTTGIIGVSRKQAGMYRSDGTSWIALRVNYSAEKTYYNDSTSSVTASDVQTAIDSISASNDGKAEQTSLDAHTGDISNPHGVTASQTGAYSKTECDTLLNGKADNLHTHTKEAVGLSNVDNTADIDKPVSAPMQTALSTKMTATDYAMLAGTLSAPLFHAPLKNSLTLAHGVGSLAFSRSTTATYVDRYGTVKTAGIDEPRFEKEGLLIEGESTNLFKYSQDFSNASWIKTNVTVTPNYTQAPDGTMTAARVQGTGSGILYQGLTLNGSDSNISLWVKSAGSGLDSFRFIRNGGGGVNLSVTDEWVRLDETFLGDSGSSNCGIMRDSASNAFDLLIWGAQVEELPFASSYIPTADTPVTRGADSLTAEFSGNVPDTTKSVADFSILMDVDVFEPAYTGYLFRAYTSSWDNLSCFTSNGILYLDSYSDGGSKRVSADISSAKNNTVRVGCVFNDTSNLLYVDGVLMDSASRNGAPVTDTIAATLNIGKAVGSLQLNGHISNFRIYDKGLNNAQMRIA